MKPNLSVAGGLQEGHRGGLGVHGDDTGSWSTLLSFSSQYMAFFEFNNRLEAILSKAYIYR